MKSNTKVTLGVVALVIILGLLVYAVGFKQQGTGFGTPSTGTVGAANCAQNPALVATGVDALVANSNVTPSSYSYIANGVYKGSSYTPVYGDNLQILADPTGYLSDQESVTAGCGNTPVGFKFLNYANATVLVYTDAGTATLTNNVAGGATNESLSTGSKNWKVTFTGVSQKSTGKMLYVVELPTNSASNVSAVKMSCNGVSVSQVGTISPYIASSNTNSYRAAFEIGAINDGVKVECNLQETNLAGKNLMGGVYTTVYAEQKFVDVDGTIKEGVYDTNGNAKYQDKYSYNFFIASS